MRRLVFVVCAFVFSCTGSCPGCPEWQATPAAGFRRLAAARLEMCIKDHGCSLNERDVCMADVRAFCLDAGYPKECGYGEPEFTTLCR